VRQLANFGRLQTVRMVSKIPKPSPVIVDEVDRLRAELAKTQLELLRVPKVGLVWEERVEQAELDMHTRLPVLVAKPKLNVQGTMPSDRPHLLMEGDNLHALTILQATHKGKIDVIYIDPPYNTGKEFIYNDKLIGEEHEWRHSAWLSFMDKRLRLARDLLATQGILFISIDDNEQAKLTLLCDQIFGEANRYAVIPVQSRTAYGIRPKPLLTNHEYVLAYTKGSPNLKGSALSAKTLRTRYSETDEEGRRFYWRNFRFSNGSSHALTLENGTVDHGPWQWEPVRTERAIDEGIIRFRGSIVEFRQYPTLDPRPTGSFVNSRYVTGAGTRMLNAVLGTKRFENPKATELLTDLIGLCASPEAIVLDFFAGSGTSAQAVATLNANDGGQRQAILVTNNENGICRKVTQPRIKAVLTGNWADGKTRDSLPGSLVYYQIDLLGKRSSPAAEREVLSKRAAEIVACLENTHTLVKSTDRYTLLTGDMRSAAIVPVYLYSDEYADTYAELQAELPENTVTKTIYLFSGSDEPIAEDIGDQFPGWDVRPLPATILAAMTRGIRAAALRALRTDEED